MLEFPKFLLRQVSENKPVYVIAAICDMFNFSGIEHAMKLAILSAALKVQNSATVRLLLQRFEMDKKAMTMCIPYPKWGDLSTFDSLLCRDLIETFDLSYECFSSVANMLQLDNLADLRAIVDRFKGCFWQYEYADVYKHIKRRLQWSGDELSKFLDIVFEIVNIGEFKKAHIGTIKDNLLQDCFDACKSEHFNLLLTYFDFEKKESKPQVVCKSDLKERGPEAQSTQRIRIAKPPLVIAEKNKQDDIDLYFSDPTNNPGSVGEQGLSGYRDLFQQLATVIKNHPVHIVQEVIARFAQHSLEQKLYMHQKITLINESLNVKKSDTARFLLNHFEMDVHTMQSSCATIKWGDLTAYDPELCREIIESFDLPKSCFSECFDLQKIKTPDVLDWLISRFELCAHKNATTSFKYYEMTLQAIRHYNLGPFVLFTEMLAPVVDEAFKKFFIESLLRECIVREHMDHFDALAQSFNIDLIVQHSVLTKMGESCMPTVKRYLLEKFKETTT